MTETAWPPVAAMCAAGVRDEALHARCHAYGCECPCHVRGASTPQESPDPVESDGRLVVPAELAAGDQLDVVTFELSCAHCGNPLTFVGYGKVEPRLSVMQLRCAWCRADVALVAELRQLTSPRPGSYTPPPAEPVEVPPLAPRRPNGNADVAQPDRIVRRFVRETATNRVWRVVEEDTDSGAVFVRAPGRRLVEQWLNRDEYIDTDDREPVTA